MDRINGILMHAFLALRPAALESPGPPSLAARSAGRRSPGPSSCPPRPWRTPGGRPSAVQFCSRQNCQD